jgi:hypothetical protein
MHTSAYVSSLDKAADNRDQVSVLVNQVLGKMTGWSYESLFRMVRLLRTMNHRRSKIKIPEKRIIENKKRY